MRTGIITLLAVLSVSCSENSIPDVKTNYIDLGLSVNWSPDNVQTADKASSIPSLADAQELIDNCYFIKEDAGVRCISKLNGNSVFFPVSSKCMSYSIDGFVGEYSNSALRSTEFLNHVEQNSVSIKDYLSDAVVFNNRIYSGDRLIDDPVKARSATSLVALDKRYDIFPLTVGYCDVLFFDKDKRFIKTVESYISEPVKKETFPENAYYIAFNYYRDSMMNDGAFHATTYEPRFGNKLYPSASITSTGRPIINIYATDTQESILLKLIKAVYIGNCDVIWEKAEYHFSDIYLYMRDELGWRWTMEMPIGGGCRYYFNGATVIADYPDNYSDSMNIFGCRALGGESYELHDAVLINNGGTYCVHDEALGGSRNYYSHRYFNCDFKLNSGKGTEEISKCIGGGAGYDGDILIANCTFSSDGAWDVEWHQMEDCADARMNIIIYGCRFAKGLALDSVPGPYYSVLLCKNNQFQGSYSVGEGWKVSQDAVFALGFANNVSITVKDAGTPLLEKRIIQPSAMEE